MLAELQDFGIWGHKGIDKIDFKKEVFFVLAFKPSRMHLGYLSLFKQIKMFLSYNVKVFCVLSTLEAYKNELDINTVNQDIEKCFKQVFKFVPTDNLKIIKDTDLEFQLWSGRVAKELKLSKIKSLLGWNDDKNISDFNTSVNMVTSFLCPQFYYNVPVQTIITCGINEISFIEMAKIVSQKLNFTEPSLTLPLMTQNIKGSQRMSSTDTEHTLFLDQNRNDMKKMLLKTLSGGRASLEEQRKIGGDIEQCIFASYVFSVLAKDKMENLINICKNGESCKRCKDKFIDEIIDQIKN